MAIRLNRLGGTDWGEERLKPTTDLVPTLNAVVDEHRAIGGNVAENAYKTLKAAGSYENGDNIMADRFTTYTGVNSTYISNTAQYTTNHYWTAGTEEVVCGYLRLNGNETSVVCYANTQNTIYNSGTGDGSNDTENDSLTLSVSQGSQTAKFGIQIMPKYDCILKTVTKASSSTATRCYLYCGNTFSTSSLIEGSIVYSSNTATFSKNIVLEAGKKYWIVNDNNGSSYTAYGQGATFPILGTNCYFIRGKAAAESAGNVYEIESFVTQNITGSVTAVTSVLFKISDGTTTTSDVAVDSQGKAVINISSLSFGPMEITMTLTTTDSTIVPEIYGYGVNILR